MARPLLTLVAPTRNEAENVAGLVRELSKALDGIAYELLFVDDSDDETPRAIREAMRGDRRVRLLHREDGQRVGGLATAVVAGIHQARGEFVCVIDGDLQHPPALVPTLLTAAQDADVVVASRYIAGGSSAGLGGVTRQVVSRGSRAAAVALFPRLRHCSDPMSGFFLFRRAVVEGVELRPYGFKILLEILVRGHWSRLTEIPYTFKERAAGASKADVSQGAAYLHHLSELRFHGTHGHGAVRYRRQRAVAGPDDPQPLDDDLPDGPEVAGKHRRRLIWIIALMAVALRIVLLPIGHNWDLTIDYNVFIDLAHNHSPYDTIAYLSHIAKSAGWDNTYEYYAYPPAPLYIYWPLAHLYALLHPTATYFIPVSGTFAVPNLTPDFFFLLKLPIWIADFLVAALLARMAGTIRGWRDYLLNPFVLLVSAAWTFDAIMLLGLVAGAYYLQQGKMGRSGLALAFGTMVKFFPALLVPTFILFLIKKQRPLREIVAFVAAFGIGCIVLLGPFLSGLLYVVDFHGSRVGGGMNWVMLARLNILFPNPNLDAISYAISAFGTPILAIALLIAYWYVYTNAEMRLNRMILVTLLAFLVGSKLVNEQYALLVFPFALLEGWQVGGAWRWFARLLWIVPIAFAVVRVPIERFLWLVYHMAFGSRADVITLTGVTGLQSPFIPWQNPMMDAVLIAVLGTGFSVLCLVALVWPVRPARAWHRYDPLDPVHARPLRVATASPSGEDTPTLPPAVLVGS